MTIQELIDELGRYDQNADVKVWIDRRYVDRAVPADGGTLPIMCVDTRADDDDHSIAVISTPDRFDMGKGLVPEDNWPAWRKQYVREQEEKLLSKIPVQEVKNEEGLIAWLDEGEDADNAAKQAIRRRSYDDTSDR